MKVDRSSSVSLAGAYILGVLLRLGTCSSILPFRIDLGNQ